MSAPPSRSPGRRGGRAVTRVLDGSADRLPPAWTVALLPLVGVGLLLLAGLGWAGVVLVLAVVVAAVVALVRAASWSDLVQPGDRRSGLPTTAAPTTGGEDLLGSRVEMP